MSHPLPGHDYTEQHNQETNAEYKRRVREGTRPLNATQKMTGKWLKDAGKSMKRPNETSLGYLKRVTSHKNHQSKDKAIKHAIKRTGGVKGIVGRLEHRDEWPTQDE